MKIAMHACVLAESRQRWPPFHPGECPRDQLLTRQKILSTCKMLAMRPLDVQEVSIHFVIKTAFSEPALVVCLELIRDRDVKIPLLLLVRFACQESCHLFVLFDSQDISEIEDGLLPMGIFAMRTGGE